MTDPMKRLRAADPAAGDRQPDERAERDLRLLLAEAPAAIRETPLTPQRHRTPMLVTAAVAVLVIALTAAVLSFVHPRTDVGGPPTIDTSTCHPAALLPFQCGTYRSTYGGKAVTGDLGGPAKDVLSISFTAHQGALLLTARTDGCFAESVLVRYTAKRLIRLAEPVSSNTGCDDPRSWAYNFLRGPLTLHGSDGPYFGTGDSAVFFEYQGGAPIGQKQLPRNDKTCIAAHVAPFSCSTYFSTGGTGTLTFLNTSLFRLSFDHYNGQLTAGFAGRCNGLSVVMEPDRNTVVVLGASATAMGCSGAPGAEDNAIVEFFSGVLTYRIDGDVLTFASGSSTAGFSTRIGACLPLPATSPFCGSSTAKRGSGSLAFLGTDPYRITFGQSGEQLTATVKGACNATTYAVTVGWSSLRFRILSSTHPTCSTTATKHDAAVAAFLATPLVYEPDGDRLTLDSASGPSSSAEFTSDR